ncbi:hypothetical protein C7S18_01520 [Ahniella affigens]|uniref:Uncharacterized protein n=1 Tax=Ahniella affigens TaxID=2021234 RepID=A0A2P1PM84_9GAMM|nr:hypothetical protein [Ahniella affigens]AVP95954.1 hypothetical protein C7S18_01520 [Ahniella affigens]
MNSVTRAVFAAVLLASSGLSHSGVVSHVSLAYDSDESGTGDTVQFASAANAPVVTFAANNKEILSAEQLAGALPGAVLYDGATNQILPIRVADGATTNTNVTVLALSGNGRWLAILSQRTLHARISGVGFNNPGLFLLDRNSGAVGLVNHLPGQADVASQGLVLSASISQDGERVYFRYKGTDLVSPSVQATDELVYGFERASGDIRLASPYPSGSNGSTGLKADVRWLSADGNDMIFGGSLGTGRFQFASNTTVALPESARSDSLTVDPSGLFGLTCAKWSDGQIQGPFPVWTRTNLQTGESLVINPLAGGSLTDSTCSEPAYMNRGASVIAYSSASRTPSPAISPFTLIGYRWTQATQQSVSISDSVVFQGQATEGNSEVLGIDASGNRTLFRSTGFDLIPDQVFAFANAVYLHDQAAGSRRLLSSSAANPNQPASVSAIYALSDDSYIIIGDGEMDPTKRDWNEANDVYRVVLGQRPALLTTRASHRPRTGFIGVYTALLAEHGRWLAMDTLNRAFSGVDADSNRNYDTFLVDTWTGSRQLLSRSTSNSQQASNGGSELKLISADGNVVVFDSNGRDLDAAPVNNTFQFQTFAYHRNDNRLTTVNRGVNGGDFGTRGQSVAISSDGTKVAYVAGSADSLISGYVGPSAEQLLVLSTADQSATLVSHAPGNDLTGADAPVTFVAASPSMRYVVFTSSARNLGVAEPGSSPVHYLADLVANTLTPLDPGQASTPLSGQRVRPYRTAFFSKNEQFLFFESRNPGLATPIEPGLTTLDCFRMDLSNKAWTRVTGGGVTVNLDQRCVDARDDGQQVLLERVEAPSGGAGMRQIWWRDLITATEKRLSTSNVPGRNLASGDSEALELSSDGTSALFVSGASDLVSGASASGDQSLYRALTGPNTLEWVNRKVGATDRLLSLLTWITAKEDLSEVAFTDYTNVLVAGYGDTNFRPDAFLFRSTESLLNPGMSGLWTEPGNEGQGFQLVPLPATGQMLVSWYTYRTDTQSGTRTDQRWMLGLGEVVGDTVQFNLSAADDGVFDSNPAGAQSLRGTLTIRMQSCLAAEAQYQLNAEGGNVSGTIPLARISADTVCQNFRSGQLPALSNDTTTSNLWRVAHNGAWHNPAKPGQGLILDVSPQTNQLVATWFTFDPGNILGNGRQAPLWLAAVGTLDGNSSRLSVFESKGGRLDAPNATVLAPVGTLDLTPTSCNTLSGQYQLQLGGATVSGSLPLERITPAPVDC